MDDSGSQIAFATLGLGVTILGVGVALGGLAVRDGVQQRNSTAHLDLGGMKLVLSASLP